MLQLQLVVLEQLQLQQLEQLVLQHAAAGSPPSKIGSSALASSREISAISSTSNVAVSRVAISCLKAMFIVSPPSPSRSDPAGGARRTY
ncbi:hypothetical protein [Acrocarpospora sp. B8E8]|uniref:hypothetical protein n=1 Tax=Acrocarpospora sp. B8E8 TaxID=3153572 RepID=UPI00325D1531